MQVTLEKENIRPLKDEMVRVKYMGNITELFYRQKTNKTIHIKKIDADRYIDLATGEIKYFKKIKNRSQDMNAVRVSLNKLRDYLNTNITDVSKCRWVTLTYAENMTDTKKLYADFKRFNMKLRYSIGHYEYIVAMEPQGRGAWHCHVVMIFRDKAPYIPNELIAEKWGHGFVTVKKLDDVDNVGAYLTAYLGDMELTKDTVDIEGDIKEVEIQDESGQKIKKKYIKGARLRYYPPKFNLYRCSRGIKNPKIEFMEAKRAEKKVSGATLTFEKTICLTDEQTDFKDILNYRYYNIARKDIQEKNT